MSRFQITRDPVQSVSSPNVFFIVRDGVWEARVPVSRYELDRVPFTRMIPRLEARAETAISAHVRRLTSGKP